MKIYYQIVDFVMGTGMLIIFICIAIAGVTMLVRYIKGKEILGEDKEE